MRKPSQSLTLPGEPQANLPRVRGVLGLVGGQGA